MGNKDSADVGVGTCGLSVSLCYTHQYTLLKKKKASSMPINDMILIIQL